MFKAQMSNEEGESHVQQLLTSYVFLQSIPTHLHRELMAFVSQQRRNQDPEADAAVNLLEVPVAVFLDALRARLGPDARITASPIDTVTPSPSGKPVSKTPDRPWGKKTQPQPHHLPPLRSPLRSLWPLQQQLPSTRARFAVFLSGGAKKSHFWGV